ncbi:MAG: transposase [Pseudobacteriovorax sp.]|nr:transposase [Pseudobacteriovorax sp.]
MVKKKQRNRYSKEFKSNAVKMSLKDGVQVKDVARELGIPSTYLSNWRKDFLSSQEAEAVEARVDAISEAKKLKEENRKLKMELEIVKKAAVFFASQK